MELCDYATTDAMAELLEFMVAVGLTGSDLTRTGGASWMAFDTTAYNSVQFSGTTGWAVGAKGRIARLVTFPRR